MFKDHNDRRSFIMESLRKTVFYRPKLVSESDAGLYKAENLICQAVNTVHVCHVTLLMLADAEKFDDFDCSQSVLR